VCEGQCQCSKSEQVNHEDVMNTDKIRSYSYFRKFTVKFTLEYVIF